MANVSILTDSTAQFIQPNFSGRERVFVIPFELQMGAKLGDGSSVADGGAQPRLTPPSVAEFLQYYTRLTHQFNSVLILLLSSHLNPAMDNAVQAATQFNNNSSVEVVDLQTAALGLGMLVQLAAEAAQRGASLTELARLVRVALPRIYSLFCIPDLMVLAQAGHMGQAQAMVGEMMGMLPIFTLEEGHLVPMEKVRTQRHLFEAFQDFMSEFEHPTHIALLHGLNYSSLRTRPLRQYMQEFFPETPFTEHALQPQMAALFGPQAVGLVISELGDLIP